MERIAGNNMPAKTCHFPLCRHAGFTATELMVVLSIALIFLTIAIPCFSALITTEKISLAVDDFFMAVNLTRSEAIRRGTRVDLVPSKAQDWATGWTVFIDANDNQIVDAGEEVITTHGPLSGNLKVKSTLTDSSKTYLAYIGSGRTRTNSSAQTPQFGTISFTLDNQIRRIKLNFLGRPRLCNPKLDKTCTGSEDS
jgi:type IV fimbrial biogenesis protein FimT